MCLNAIFYHCPQSGTSTNPPQVGSCMQRLSSPPPLLELSQEPSRPLEASPLASSENLVELASLLVLSEYLGVELV